MITGIVYSVNKLGGVVMKTRTVCWMLVLVIVEGWSRVAARDTVTEELSPGELHEKFETLLHNFFSYLSRLSTI